MARIINLAKEIQKLLEDIDKETFVAKHTFTVQSKKYKVVLWSYVRDRICDFREKVLAE